MNVGNDLIILGVAALLIVIFSCCLALEDGACCRRSASESTIERGLVLLSVSTMVASIQVVEILWLLLLHVETSALGALAQRNVVRQVRSSADQAVNTSTSANRWRSSTWLLRDFLGLQSEVLSVRSLLLILFATIRRTVDRGLLSGLIVLAQG